MQRLIFVLFISIATLACTAQEAKLYNLTADAQKDIAAAIV